MRIILGAAGLAIWASGTIAMAQADHDGHGAGMDHAAHGDQVTSDAALLTEPGQGAFAALSEVVQVLEADPGTDWSRVDLAGLRAHLVDMDLLVSGAVVTEESLTDGLLATATGDAQTLAALGRMVPAHAAQLASDPRWTVSAGVSQDAVTLRVTSPDPSVVARIQGLGFFGIMASQDHHRAHHLALARGDELPGH